MNKKGRLHIVGTPIGNMGDITLRAIETLKVVDLVACEDTRRTLGLLTHFGISKSRWSAYYKPKEREGARRVLASLERGDEVALVTDARHAVHLRPRSAAGQRGARRRFRGDGGARPDGGRDRDGFERNFGARVCIRRFFAPKRKDAEALLTRCDSAKGTIVLYSSPHSINDDLALIYATLGERDVHIVRELTKGYEGVDEVTLPHVIDEPKGEYVLLIGAASAEEQKPQGLARRTACRDDRVGRGQKRGGQKGRETQRRPQGHGIQIDHER